MSWEDSIVLAFDCDPSDLPKLFWKKTLNDLRLRTGLYIRFEMVKAMSTTESLLFVVGQMFGSKEPEGEQLNSVADMMAAAREFNGG